MKFPPESTAMSVLGSVVAAASSTWAAPHAPPTGRKAATTLKTDGCSTQTATWLPAASETILGSVVVRPAPGFPVTGEKLTQPPADAAAGTSASESAIVVSARKSGLETGRKRVRERHMGVDLTPLSAKSGGVSTPE